MSFVRAPALAGTFYPATAEALRGQIAAMLNAAPPPAAEAPKAIIAPHAGTIYSGPTAALAYARLLPARARITRVVMIGPAHRLAFRGIAASTAESFSTPLGEVPIDRQAIARIAGLPNVGVLDQAHEMEHCIEIHLPFLQMVLERFSLVPLVAGQATPEQAAAVFARLWGGEETLLVASSDLSHYHEYGEARRIDAATADAIERLDPAPIGYDQACGRTGVNGLLLLARQQGLRVERVDLRNSGDTAGPRDRVVGYGAWAFYEPSDPEARLRRDGRVLLAAARQAIALALEGRRPVAPDPRTLPAGLAANGAAFVTLKRDGRLRGCIGSPAPYRPLAIDVIENALAAAFSDPRFPPLTRDEQAGIEVSLSILTPQQPMTFADEADLLTQLRPGIDGLVIADGDKRALFLPSVWEMIPGKVEFLRQLKLKAGMTADHWSPGFAAARFQAVEVK